MSRLSKDEYYLLIAGIVSMRSTCLRKHYGAVIVKDDRIIATGYNGAPRGETNCCDAGRCYMETCSLPIDTDAAGHGMKYGNCVAVHAEQNALISAAGTDLRGATLYLAGADPSTGKWINARPCNICSRMIKNSGILRTVYGEASE